MPFVQHVLPLTLFTLLASAGCGSSTNPLSGSWSNDTCFGSASMADDIESCAVTLKFTDALEISLEADWVSLPATADYPGCTTTKKVSGQSWSTTAESDYDVLFVEGNGSATVERSGCVYEEDDLEATAVQDISIPSGEIEYHIRDNVLSILSSNLEGSYAP